MARPRPLVIFGCVHIGHKNADLKMAHHYVDFVRQTDGIALLLADNHENAIPKKQHMMFDQNLTPQEQLDYSVELFSSIKNNIIGACSGNHAGRTRHEAGIDLDKEMCHRLGIIDKYSPNQGFVSAKIGTITYKTAFRHGTGFGSNVFGNCISLHRAYPLADICAASHTHQVATTKMGRWDIDSSGERRFHPVTLINTGSLLNYPNYADEAYYAPQPKGFAIAWLYPNELRVDVDVSGKIPTKVS